jgi:AraC-like DNA-binding protein
LDTRWPGEAGKPLRDLGVVYGSLSTLQAPYRLVRGDNERRHCFYLFVIEGTLELETSAGDHRLTPGTLVAMPNRIDRRLELVEGSCYRELYFSIREDEPNDLLKVDSLFVREAQELDKLVAAYKGYYGESQKEPRPDEAARHYGELLALLFKREAMALKQGFDDQANLRFARLFVEIEERVSFPWTVAEMARRLCVAPSHLYRLTRKYYGMSPMELVEKQRIGQAKRLLRNTSHSLETIAVLTGYATPHGFSNAFRRATGTRPGRYRKE